MMRTIDILRASLRRLLLTSALGAVLVGLATYVVLRIDAPTESIVVFAAVVVAAVVMQTMQPGAGIARRPRHPRREPAADRR